MHIKNVEKYDLVPDETSGLCARDIAIESGHQEIADFIDELGLFFFIKMQVIFFFHNKTDENFVTICCLN